MSVDVKYMEECIVEGLENVGSPTYSSNATVSVSSLGFCMRKAYLSHILRKRAPLNSSMLYGKLVHYALPAILDHIPEFTGAVYESYLTIPLKYGVLAGHPDIMTEDKVWEVKTTSIKSLKYSAVPVTYYTQANTYCGMASLDEYGLIIIDSDIVFSKGKEITLDTVVVIMNEFDEDVYEMHLDVANEIDEAIHDHPEPYPVEFTRSCPSFKGECKTCHVKSMCRRIYDGEECEDSC